MKIAKSKDGRIGENSTMYDERRRVTMGFVDDNNQNAEVKFPIDGFEINEAVDVTTSYLPKRRTQK
jgi:hypothetical protein